MSALPPGWWRSNLGSIAHTGFQRQVFPQPAPGVEGDFAAHNPRASVLAGPGGLVAGPEGVIVGRFAWISTSRIDPNNAPAIAQCSSNGMPVAGFIHREQQGLITYWLGGWSMHVPQGFPVTVHQAGDFFVINRGETYAHLNMNAFARNSDGAVLFGLEGDMPGSAEVTGAVAPEQFTIEGSLLGNLLSVTAVTAGTVMPGATLTGTDVYPGTRIVEQVSGQMGGTGTYAVNIASQHTEPGTMTGDYGVLTITAIASGTVQLGSMLTNGGPPGVFITQFLTGTGNVGTYAVNDGTAQSGTIFLSGATKTKWFATSAGNPGELIKISSWPLG